MHSLVFLTEAHEWLAITSRLKADAPGLSIFQKEALSHTNYTPPPTKQKKKKYPPEFLFQVQKQSSYKIASVFA